MSSINIVISRTNQILSAYFKSKLELESNLLVNHLQRTMNRIINVFN